MPDKDMFGESYQPFKLTENQYDAKVNLLDVAEQLLDGFIGGFTTINIGDAPRDDYSEIARNIGHLAGFIGFIPGLGSLGGLAARSLYGGAGAALKIGKATGMGTSLAKGVIRGSKSVGQFTSVPMAGANLIMRTASQYGGKTASATAKKFLQKGLSDKAIDAGAYVAQGGMHLGLASGISSWQEGTDAMLDSFLHGAMAGGMFRGLGQVLPNAAGRMPKGNVIQNFKRVLSDNDGKFSPDGKGILRILASSAFTGLPSTIQGQTTPTQIYQYLLGGVFGAGEMSISQRNTLGYFQKAPLEKFRDTRDARAASIYGISNPETYTYYKESTPEVQKMIKQELNLRGMAYLNTTKAVAEQLSEAGVPLQITPSGAYAAKSIMGALIRNQEMLWEAKERGEITEKDYIAENRAMNDAMFGAQISDFQQTILKEIDKKDHSLNKKTEIEKEEYAFQEAYKAAANKVQLFLESEKLNTSPLLLEGNKIKQALETVNGKTFSKFTEVMEDIKAISPMLKSPIEQISQMSYNKGVADKLYEYNSKDYVKHTIKVAKFFKKEFGTDVNTPWDKLIKKTKKRFDIELKEPELYKNVKGSKEYQSLRRAFNAKAMEPVPLLIVELNKNYIGRVAVHDAGNLNRKGGKITMYKDTPFLQERLKGKTQVYNLKNIARGAVEEEVQKRKDNKFLTEEGQDLSFERILSTLHSDGKTVFMGTKDNSNLLVVDYMEGARTYEEADATIQRAMEHIKATEGPEAVTAFKEAMLSFEAEYMANAKIPKSKKLDERRRVYNETFVQGYANNLLLIPELYSMNLETYLSNRKKFDLVTPAQLNKRGSLLNNGFNRFDADYISKRISDVENNEFKVLLINDLNKDGSSQVEGFEDITRYRREGEKLINIRTGEQVDGYIKTRGDVYEARANAGGLDINTGSTKGTLVSSNPEHGLLLGKFAYHKASVAETKLMLEKGVHDIIVTSSAKERGLRETTDIKWDFTKEKATLNFNEASVYKVPIKDFTFTEAGEHSATSVASKSILSQMLSGLHSGTHEAARKELSNIINNKFQGDETINELSKQYRANPESVDIDKIEVDKLGANEINDIIFQTATDNKLYRKVLGEVVRALKDNDHMKTTPYGDTQKAQREQSEIESRPAEELLDLWSEYLSPALLSNKMILPYIQNAVKYYMINKVTHPKLEGSFDSNLQPFTGEVAHKFGKIFKPGTVILSQTSKGIEIPWQGGMKKLGEAVEEYDKTTDKKTKASMEEELSIVIERVPTGAASSIRVVRVLGFQDVAGNGIVMHPEDMANTDGADLDIDKITGFTRFSKEFKDNIKASMDDQYDYYNPRTGRKLKKTSKIKDKVKVFRDPKEGNDLFLAKEDGRDLNSEWAKFSSVRMAEINENAVRGNALLDPGIGTAKVLEGYADYLLHSKDDLPIHIKKDGKITKSILKYKDLDIEGFRDAKFTLINRAADAADGTKLVDANAVRQTLWDVLTKYKGGQFSDVLSTNGTLKVFQKLNSAVKAKGRKLTLEDDGYVGGGDKATLGQIRNDVLKAISSNSINVDFIRNPYFQGAVKLAELNYAKYHPKHISFLSNNIESQFEKLQHIIINDKDIEAIYGIHLKRNSDDVTGLKLYNDPTKYESFVQRSKVSYEDGLNWHKELVSQDMSDLNSYFAIKSAVPRDYDAGVLVKIHKHIAKQKEQIYKIKQQVEKNFEKNGYSNKDALEGQIEKAIQKFKDNSIPEKYHNFYDMVFISSVKHQGVSFADYKSGRIKTITKDSKKAIKKVQEGTDLPETKKVMTENIKQSLKDKIDRASRDAKKEWQSTNISDQLFRYKAISQEMKSEWGRIYNETVQKVSGEIRDEELGWIGNYSKSKYITKEMLYPRSKTVAYNFHSLAPFYAKTPVEGVSGILKGKMLASQEKLTQILQLRPDLVAELDALFAGEILKRNGIDGVRGVETLGLSKPQDFIWFVDRLDKLHRAKNIPPPEIKNRYYWRNYKFTGKDIRDAEGRMVTSMAKLKSPGAQGWGEVKFIESTYETAGSIHNQIQVHGDAMKSRITEQHNHDEMQTLQRDLNAIEPGLGDKVHDWSMRQHEARVGDKSKDKFSKEVDEWLRKHDTPQVATIIKDGELEYTIRRMDADRRTPEQKDLYREALEHIDERKTAEYMWEFEKVYPELKKFVESKITYKIPSLKREMTGAQIVEFYRGKQKAWSERMMRTKISDAQRALSFLQEPRPKGEEILDSYGYIKRPQLAKALLKEFQSGRPRFFSNDLVDRMKHQISLEKIRMNPEIYFNELLDRWTPLIEGQRHSLDIRQLALHPQIKKIAKEYESTKKVRGGDAYDHDIFPTYLRLLREEFKSGQKSTLLVGELPTRDMQSRTWNRMKGGKINSRNWVEYRPIHEKIDQWWTDTYFPHMDYYEGAMEQKLMETMVEVASGVSQDRNQMSRNFAEIKERYYGSREKNDVNNTNESSKIVELLESEYIDVHNIEKHLSTFSNGLHRSTTNPTPGWKTSSNMRLLYEVKANRVYWDSMASFVTNDLIKQMEAKKPFGEQTPYWAQFLHQFNREMISGQSMLPDSWRGDTNMGLKNNPYWYLADTYWTDKIDKMRHSMFSGSKLMRKLPGLKADQVKLAMEIPQARALIKDLFYRDASTKLAMISNMEAKYELLTLLSHSKTWVNNMVGGSVNTYSSMGMQHFRNAMNVDFLKNNVFLDFKSKGDILKFVEDMGGIEAMFTSQFGLDPLFKTHKMQEMVGQTMSSLKGGRYNEKKLKEIWKESGASETFMNTAAWFMKSSEVKLRSRAWMAHYLAARESMDASGMTLEKDHPWLVQWANKGVEATQFLYNNANRAPFARTNLGKVFSRFQLWTWNSLKFRKEIFALAHEANYEEGSAGFNRLKRLMTADIFVFAMAKAFAMSTFDNSLPPPLSYMADLGEYFFGEEDQKRRAFYGVLPYPANIVGIGAPPIGRIPFGIITSLADGSLDGLAHRVTSWIPFGRLAKSTYRFGQNPESLIKQYTGLPIDKLGDYFENSKNFETPKGFKIFSGDEENSVEDTTKKEDSKKTTVAESP